MTTTKHALTGELVAEMLAHMASIGVDAQELASDPVAVIPAVDGIVLDWVEPAALGGGCSVAALYSGTEIPPRISVLTGTSEGRCNFSLLHEFGHHLCPRVPAVAAALWELPEGEEGAFEEDLVDSFAAAILLPTDTVNRVFAAGVTAASVIQLWQSTAASREACCVAAAHRLSAPGYVMLLKSNGRSQFAARHGDVLPIARDSAQTAARLQPAVRGGTSRGVDRPTYRSGVAGQQMYLDAQAAGGYTFAVWVTDSPAWLSLAVPLDARPVAHDGHCSGCGKDFTSWKAPCTACGELRCPQCGACDCAPGGQRPVANRRCTECFQSLPLVAFVGDSNVCNQH